MGTSREGQYTYFITPPAVLLRVTNVTYKRVETSKTKHSVLNYIFLKVVSFMR